MKSIFVITSLTCLSFSSISQDKAYVFDLHQPDKVKSQLSIFVEALHTNDTTTEFKFRNRDYTYMRYKSMQAAPDYLDPNESLATQSFLSQIRFGDIYVDTINNMIMRTYYTEPENKKNKHRYAFHIDEAGKIDQVLYVPPITKEYFPEWDDEQFKTLISRLDTATVYTDEIEPDMYEYELHRCAEVMPEIELIMAEDIENLKRKIDAMEPDSDEKNMEIDDNSTPNKTVTEQDLNSKMND